MKISIFVVLTAACKATVKIFHKDIIKKVLGNLLRHTIYFAGGVCQVRKKGTFLMKGFLQLSEKVCYKIAENGKDFTNAYLFVRNLSSLTKHPILLNFRSNQTSIRLLTRYTDKRFRELLSSAFTYRLIKLEGDHLRLYSRSAELKEFKAKDYTDIKISDAKAFLQVSTLKHNYKQQLKAIKYKSSTTKQGCGAGDGFNLHALAINEVTLSYRKIAQLLNISLSYAYKVAQSLKAFGVTLTKNIKRITKEQFRQYRKQGKFNAKMDDSGCYYLKANSVTFKDFYKKTEKGQPYYLSDNW